MDNTMPGLSAHWCLLQIAFACFLQGQPPGTKNIFVFVLFLVDGLPPAVSRAGAKNKSQTTNKQQLTTTKRPKSSRDGPKTAPRPLQTRQDKHNDENQVEDRDEQQTRHRKGQRQRQRRDKAKTRQDKTEQRQYETRQKQRKTKDNIETLKARGEMPPS